MKIVEAVGELEESVVRLRSTLVVADRELASLRARLLPSPDAPVARPSECAHNVAADGGDTVGSAAERACGFLEALEASELRSYVNAPLGIPRNPSESLGMGGETRFPPPGE